jgi:hypothetical protein
MSLAIQVYAIVTGTNNLNDDGFQAVHGVFRTGNGGLLGNLSSALLAPFNGGGAQAGSQVDADGDGDLDIGANPNGGTASTFFIPRADGMMFNGVPVAGASPAAAQYLIGRLTFTLANNASGDTFITFIRRTNPNGTNNVAYSTWNEDGVGKNGVSPYTVNGIFFGPEPGSLLLGGSAAIVGLLARRQRRQHQIGSVDS